MSSRYISLISYGDFCFVQFSLLLCQRCYLRSREPHGGGVISDLLCYIVLYFSSRYIVFYLTLGACLNWRFTAQIQTWLFLPTSPSLHSHPAATSPPLPGCGAASHSVNRWTLMLPTQPLFLAHIVYAYCSCFTDKFIRRTTRLSFSWPFG